jgi:hypothetical protein
MSMNSLWKFRKPEIHIIIVKEGLSNG